MLLYVKQLLAECHKKLAILLQFPGTADFRLDECLHWEEICIEERFKRVRQCGYDRHCAESPLRLHGPDSLSVAALLLRMELSFCRKCLDRGKS
jgi:hypothetical protein